MKIAINTRLLMPNKMDGIGNYTFQIMKRVVNQHPEHKFYFLFDRPNSKEFIFADNVKPIIVLPPAVYPFLNRAWFQYSLPFVFKFLKPDVFVGMDSGLSLHSNIKQISVIHDLNFKHHPEWLTPEYVKFYNYLISKSIKKANRIIAVSEYTKNDVVQTYGYNPNSIDIVGNAVRPEFKPIDDAEKQEIKNKYTQGKDYFAFVGSMYPRKNTARLFKAFDKFCSQSNHNMSLMIIGKKVSWDEEAKLAYENMKHKDRVEFAGRVSDQELYKLVGAAFALVYVSLFEGFGVPILEGFSSGVPVVTSNVTSMPEIAGDAAILCDPYSVDSICDALTEIVENNKLRESLILKGLERKNHYTWDISADLFWKSIQKVIS